MAKFRLDASYRRIQEVRVKNHSRCLFSIILAETQAGLLPVYFLVSVSRVDPLRDKGLPDQKLLREVVIKTKAEHVCSFIAWVMIVYFDIMKCYFGFFYVWWVSRGAPWRAALTGVLHSEEGIG